MARRDETSHPRSDPNMSPPLQHRPPPFVFDPPKVSNVQLSPVIADEEETPVTPVLFGGGTILGEKAEGATQHYFERNSNSSTFVLVAPMAVSYTHLTLPTKA